MSRQRRVLALLAAVVVSVSAGCGGGEPAQVVPTAQQLATSLVTVRDYPGTWTINTPPQADPSGVIPDDQQDNIPTIELCDRADAASQATLESLRWKAGRQIDLTVADPIRPPSDRKGHMVFAQEYLTSGPAGELATTFRALRDGMAACLGDVPAGDEGPGTISAATVPAVGDDRYGIVMAVEEAGGWATWRIHTTLVLEGEVLMVHNVVDIAASVPHLFSTSQLGAMVTTAANKLPTSDSGSR